jgi:hypothetical protein
MNDNITVIQILQFFLTIRPGLIYDFFCGIFILKYVRDNVVTTINGIHIARFSVTVFGYFQEVMLDISTTFLKKS